MTATKTPKYTVGGQYFKTKAELTKAVQKLTFPPIESHKKTYVGEERSFLLELLQHHPDWKLKTQGLPLERLALKWCYLHDWNSHGLALFDAETGLYLDDISFRFSITCLQPNNYEQST